MMTASQFYVMARRLEDAYAAQMRSLCKETGVAQTAMDILLFLHNNPGYDTARDICTYRQLKSALVSLYIENLVQLGFLAREGVPEDRRKCRLVLTEAAEATSAAKAETIKISGRHTPTPVRARSHCLSVITENIRNINEKGSV